MMKWAKVVLMAKESKMTSLLNKPTIYIKWSKMENADLSPDVIWEINPDLPEKLHRNLLSYQILNPSLQVPLIFLPEKSKTNQKKYSEAEKP